MEKGVEDGKGWTGREDRKACLLDGQSERGMTFFFGGRGNKRGGGETGA